MSNYIYNQVLKSDDDKSYDELFVNCKDILNVDDYIRDVRLANENIVLFESRSTPPLLLLCELSKQCNNELILTYVNEGSFVIESQIKFLNGNIIGYRERYNDGEIVDEFPEFGPLPERLENICSNCNINVVIEEDL